MSSQANPLKETEPRQYSAERDVILRAAVAMMQNSQDITRRGLGRRAGMAAAAVVKHFKCHADLMAEIRLLGLRALKGRLPSNISHSHPYMDVAQFMSDPAS